MKPSTTDNQQPDRAALVDEFGELSRQVAEFAPTQRRLEQLRVIIAGWYADADAAKEWRVDGQVWALHVGMRERRRRITDMQRLYKVLGRDTFLRLASIAMDKLELQLSEEHLAGLVVAERTGPRRIAAVLRAPPAPPPATPPAEKANVVPITKRKAA